MAQFNFEEQIRRIVSEQITELEAVPGMTIRQAVDKQIAKKPLEDLRYFGVGKCPSCGVVFVDNSTNYCGNCGQRIDWGK